MNKLFGIWVLETGGWVVHNRGRVVIHVSKAEALRDLKDFAVNPKGYEVRPFNISEYCHDIATWRD